MANKFERLTYLGREDSGISYKTHIFQMRESNKISKELKDEWYNRGLSNFSGNTSYIERYYNNTDYWKSSMSNDELLSEISMTSTSNERLKIAGRRIAELLDEIDDLKS